MTKSAHAIRREIAKKRMTFAEFAAHCGISESYLYKILGGARISVTMGRKITNRTNLDLNYLIRNSLSVVK